MAGAHLLETPISKDQKVSFTKTGYISVKASVVDNMELRYWIRAFGNDVEVIKPISLRNDFIKMTNNLKELYENEKIKPKLLKRLYIFQCTFAKQDGRFSDEEKSQLFTDLPIVKKLYLENLLWRAYI